MIVKQRDLLDVGLLPIEHRLHGEHGGLEGERGGEEEGVIDRRPRPRVGAQILIGDLHQHERGRFHRLPGGVEGEPVGERGFERVERRQTRLAHQDKPYD